MNNSNKNDARVASGQLILSVAAIVWLALGAQDVAHAADLPAVSKLSKVEVFQRGATITRTADLNIPAGQHRLVFADLPATLDPALIRVTVGSRSVSLGSVEVERMVETDFVAAKERELRAEIEKLEDAKAALDDDIATAAAQLKLLDTVTFGHSDATQKSALDVQSLQGAVATLETSGASARNRIRGAGLRKRDLERSVAKLQADLAKVATTAKDRMVVRAAISAAAPVNAQAKISYNVDDAQWVWLYEAHLDSIAKKVVLLKQAQVRQGTGEDWTEVELLLTASRPSRNNQLAPLMPLYVRAESHQPRHYASAPGIGNTALEEVVVTGSTIGRRARRSDREDDPEQLEDLGSYVEMVAATTEFAESYLVPGRASIESNRQPRMFPVSDEDFPVELVARTIPRRESKAYLEATFRYERNIPLQAGELQLFRDEAYIGKATTETFLPGAEIRLPFGVDDRIRVAARHEQEKTGKRGLLGRQQLQDQRLRFDVTNHHSYPIKVEVLDRLPVAKSNDLRVDVIAGSTPPTHKDFEGKPGLLLWILNVEPRQTAQVRHFVEIRYPADKTLAGYEGQ